MATLQDSYNTGNDDLRGITSTTWYAQTIKLDSDSYKISSVKLLMYRSGTPGTVTVSIRATAAGKPTGADLTSGTTNGDALTTNAAGEWVEITFSSTYTLLAGTTYAIVVRSAATGLRWNCDSSSPTYTNGSDCHSTDSGSTWTINVGDDFMFETWGTTFVPVDKTYSRALVAIGNNEVWYETSAGTMAELSAANNDIDIGVPLEAVEAFQKLFIANGTNLKIFDKVNTKINTTDAGANPCTRGMTLTGGTSTAEMKVDYVDAVTDDAAMNVYGYRTTTATFSSGETVTGTNSAGNVVSFVTSAAETAPPHWYNWTVFGNDTTTYGTMPSSASMIALWRGRLVCNSDEDPHAWYMTKVDDPFKIKYDYTNDGEFSAVIYTTGKVGTIGDILTTLIAYKDDLCIFGCANSIHVIVGDPMADGQLVQITDDTGIWGSRAWCFDDKNNLYFFGNDGLYRMTVGETVGYPENISKRQLPNLVKDWDLDKNTHRVVVTFDPIEQGILVYKTTLDGGDNAGYFYSLVTGGFFPEDLDDTCGIYSAYFYPATDETYRKYLIGCTDGYIREFDRSTKNDTTTASTAAINSYYTVLKQMGEDEFTEGLLRKLSGIVAGGAASGDFSDTDSVSWAIYNGDDAETVLEDIRDGATAFTSGTWSTTGKQVDSRVRMRGTWAGLKLSNSTASQTWAIEKVFGDIELRKGKK